MGNIKEENFGEINLTTLLNLYNLPPVSKQFQTQKGY